MVLLKYITIVIFDKMLWPLEADVRTTYMQTKENFPGN